MTSLYGASTDSTYQKTQLGGVMTRGTRPAIVVVDLSNGFTDSAYPTGGNLDGVVEATRQLIERGRHASVPVIYTTMGFSEAEHSAIKFIEKAPGLKSLKSGTRAVEIDHRLDVAESDHVVLKKNASAFFGTGLNGLLNGLGVDTVLVCGTSTSGCVRATTVDAISHGFSVLVPSDCVGDRAQGPHEAALFDIAAKYGDVITREDAVAYLSGLSAVHTIDHDDAEARA